MLALSRPVDDTAHHRDLEVFHPGVLAAPARHGGAQVVVDLFGQILESGAGGAATAGAGGDAGDKGAQAQGLQNLGRHHHLLGACLAGLWRQGHPNGVANALLQQHRQRSGRRHRAFGAHAGFGQAQVQRVVAALGQGLVHRNQVLHATDLARQDNVLARHAHGLGLGRRVQRRGDQRLVHHLLDVPRHCALVVLVHQAGEQILVQTAPVHANAHRLAVAQRHLDHLGKLPVTLVAAAHIAGGDAVFGQSLGAGRVVRQQLVAVVVKVANQRHMDAHAVELLADVGHRLRRFVVVDGDAHQLGAGLRQFLDWDRGGHRVGGVGVGHGLHAHRGVAANSDGVVAPHHTPHEGTAGRSLPHRYRQRGIRHAHCTSNLATLLRTNGVVSKSLPRTTTRAAAALPKTTR